MSGAKLQTPLSLIGRTDSTANRISMVARSVRPTVQLSYVGVPRYRTDDDDDDGDDDGVATSRCAQYPNSIPHTDNRTDRILADHKYD